MFLSFRDFALLQAVSPPSNLLQSPSPLPHRRRNSSLPSQLVESSHCHSSAARLLRSLPRLLQAACRSSSAPPLSPPPCLLCIGIEPRRRRSWSRNAPPPPDSPRIASETMNP
ncbi:hypothetical protein S83_045125 [Arachis hypogaea]